VARDRKRSRRGGRTRPPGTPTRPPEPGNGGLPENGAVEPENGAVDEPGIDPRLAFPQLDALQGEPVSPAAAAFGDPDLAPERPLRSQPASGNRLLGFVRGCWAELQRVQWPDRRQVAQATGVVLGFVVVASLFLGLADEISQKIVNAIL
jgi:preprotein translocase SecE subunit